MIIMETMISNRDCDDDAYYDNNCGDDDDDELN
jgi:hypothetical protein